MLGAGRLASAELNASLAAAGGGRLRLSMVQLLFSAASTRDISSRTHRDEFRVNRKYARMIASFLPFVLTGLFNG